MSADRKSAHSELMALVASKKPWESFTASEQAEIDRLTAIAYPGGLNDMLAEAGVR